MDKGELVIMNFPTLSHKVLSHTKKEFIVKKYADKFKCNILIETGTHKGHMIEAMKTQFSEIHSIELNPEFAQTSIDLYKNNPNIKIYLGNSALLVKTILNQIDEKCIFWLDAHYLQNACRGQQDNEKSPLLQELTTIFTHSIKDHVVLIDDARFFGNNSIKHDYHPSIRDIYGVLETYAHMDYKILIYHDVIRIYREDKMKTVSKLWEKFYLELDQVNPECPLENTVIKKTMGVSRYKGYAKVIAKMLNAQDSVLEIGCGFGGLAQEILKKTEVFYTVVENEPMLTQAREFLGDKVEYIEAKEIETLHNREFKLFISNFCLSETPAEYRKYILENIIKNCQKVFIIDLKDTVKPTAQMLADGYDMVPLAVEEYLKKYFTIEKTPFRHSQYIYVGERKE